MKKTKQPGAQQRAVIKLAEKELGIGAKNLEWEIGDIWGHVGVRLPDSQGIAVQLFRRAEDGNKDWLVHFDYSLKKLSGVGTIPVKPLSILRFSRRARNIECRRALPRVHVRRAEHC